MRPCSTVPNVLSTLSDSLLIVNRQQQVFTIASAWNDAEGVADVGGMSSRRQHHILYITLEYPKQRIIPYFDKYPESALLKSFNSKEKKHGETVRKKAGLVGKPILPLG
jgi:hypothetical protein